MEFLGGIFVKKNSHFAANFGFDGGFPRVLTWLVYYIFQELSVLSSRCEIVSHFVV